MNLNKLTLKRINGDLKHFNNNGLENIMIYPNPDNILEIYFLLKGEKNTNFENGEYLCKLQHNKDYPLKAPDYYVYTPNGRFTCDRKICLTNSAFHQSDWAPGAWNLLTLLNGFYSIWHSDEKEDKVGIGHCKHSSEEIKLYAKNSNEYNKTKLQDIYKNFY